MNVHSLEVDEQRPWRAVVADRLVDDGLELRGGDEVDLAAHDDHGDAVVTSCASTSN